MSQKNTSPENCNHVCEGCSVANCGSRTNPESFKAHLHPRSKVEHVIGVVSGKGGVGKSFVTSLLASTMQRNGYNAAVLDGDITGPSMGKVFGIHERAMGDGELLMPAKTKTGIQLVSSNMLLESEDQPIIWRGPMVAGILKQFYEEVFWDDVNYMFVDMPPGTSDVPLTAFQSLPLDGIIVVTSPQELVSMVVAKAINMANMMNIPIIGLVENMSYVECDECGHKMYVFGKSHIKDVAEKYHLPVLAQIPLNEKIAIASDEGNIEDIVLDDVQPVVDMILQTTKNLA